MPNGSQSVAPTSSPTGPAQGLACADSRGTSPAPQYAFDHIAIPRGADACQDIGPFTSPKFFSITNDGANVAFNAVDFPHDGALWYGNLADRSIKLVYQAAENGTNRVLTEDPQLADGQLVWLETVHVANSGDSDVRAWSIKDMDLGSGHIKTVTSGNAPAFGGTASVQSIRSEGALIAAAETLAKGWRIEVLDLSGRVTGAVGLTECPFNLAIVGDGLLYSTGTPDPARGTMGLMHLWHWQTGRSPQQIGSDVFQIIASGDLAAWVADPIASQYSTGNFHTARLFASTVPFNSADAVSPVDSDTGTKGIDGAAVGAGTVAWWEQENYHNAWSDVLTLWQPGWKSAVQVDTEGNESDRVSLGGGWLVWTEEFGRDTAPLLERVRGIPVSALTSQVP